MKKIKVLSILMCVLLTATLLASCAAKADADFNEIYRPGDAMADDMMEKPSIEESFDGIKGDASISTPSTPSAPDSGDYERKIIKTVSITAETKSFDTAVDAINGYVSSYGGYVQSSELSGKSLDFYGRYYERNASYTVRIPAENLDAFLGDVGKMLNIVRNHGTIDDVSPQYYDIVSRLETLETEKQALQKMYEQADSIDYMLQVQQRLYDVIEEIEAYTTTLKYYDGQVSYSTVRLEVHEVIEYTDVTDPITYGERMTETFKDSWKDFAESCQDFSIWFVGAIPTLLVIAVIGGAVAGIVVLILRADHKKKINKKS